MSAKANQRTCPIQGCKVQIAGRLLMCPEHWNLCPKPLRSEVWRFYRAGQERTGMASQTYYEAARKAIEAVNKDVAAQAEQGVQQVLL